MEHPILLKIYLGDIAIQIYQSVFFYISGKKVTESHEVNWMACANKATALTADDNSCYSVFDRRNTKSTNLLGVAGTDVPIREVTKLTRDYKIGFPDLLKPGYRNVDLTEVELVDSDTGLYEFNEALLTKIILFFRLSVALLEPYGHYRVIGQIEVKRREEDWLEYFRGQNWKVHPDW
ncbi:hypothetical protein CEXT_329591 [Caerostris extrusa]|uniref:Uncharacterized protein n=1 Tax=Caerostris extrusa TaxID=172846 RepID=A0AAV4TVG5_CAEEX|nr:hypothetical protein CEXT_329591 [Caerostris extrusa]